VLVCVVVVVARTMAVVMATHGAPGVPGDAEDERGDREPDQRVGDRGAEGDDDGAGEDPEADPGVGTGVVAVRDQRRAVEPASRSAADDSRDPVAEEADDSRRGKREELGWGLGVDQSGDRLEPCHAGGDEDRQDDEQPGDPLGSLRAQQEGDAEWDRGRRVAEVVDQVGE
jgi:hypothetical protein